jgi:hypothetical protein
VPVVERVQQVWAWGKSLPVWVFDSLLVLVLVPLMIVSVVVKPDSVVGPYKPINALGILLVLAAVLPLALRRTYPFAVFLVSSGFLGLFVAAK